MHTKKYFKYAEIAGCHWNIQAFISDLQIFLDSIKVIRIVAIVYGFEVKLKMTHINLSDYLI